MSPIRGVIVSANTANLLQGYFQHDKLPPTKQPTDPDTSTGETTNSTGTNWDSTGTLEVFGFRYEEDESMRCSDDSNEITQPKIGTRLDVTSDNDGRRLINEPIKQAEPFESWQEQLYDVRVDIPQQMINSTMVINQLKNDALPTFLSPTKFFMKKSYDELSKQLDNRKKPTESVINETSRDDSSSRETSRQREEKSETVESSPNVIMSMFRTLLSGTRQPKRDGVSGGAGAVKQKSDDSVSKCPMQNQMRHSDKTNQLNNKNNLQAIELSNSIPKYHNSQFSCHFPSPSEVADLSRTLMDPQYVTCDDQNSQLSQTLQFSTPTKSDATTSIFETLDHPHPLQFRGFTKVLSSESSSSFTSNQLQNNNVSSPENTLIIWDWDDTILPTYHLAVERKLSLTDLQVAEDLIEPLAQLETKALRSLEMSMRSGCTILVTNASFRWLTDSAEKYFPDLWDFIKRHKVKILSARDVCQPLGLPQPDWKKLLIRDQVETFFERLDVPSSAVADIVTKVKNIAVDAQLIAKFREQECEDFSNDLSPALQFYIDNSIPLARRLDQFIRQFAKLFDIDPRILTMTGLLLSQPNENAQPNSLHSQEGLNSDGTSEPPEMNCPTTMCPTIDTPIYPHSDDCLLTTRIHLRYLSSQRSMVDWAEKINRNDKSAQMDNGIKQISNSMSQSDSMSQTNLMSQCGSMDGMLISPYLEFCTESTAETDLVNISLPGTKVTSYVRLTSGMLISMKDLFPNPSSDLGLAPVPCSVISIGDGLGEREAILSVMTQWDQNHRSVLNHLEELRDCLSSYTFGRFVELLLLRHSQQQKNSQNGSKNLQNDLRLSGSTSWMDHSIGYESSHCRLKAPSAAWSFKALKLAPHPDIGQLCQTHDKLQEVFELMMQVEHSIDVTVHEEHPYN